MILPAASTIGEILKRNGSFESVGASGEARPTASG
jgi:hypothetical protein